MQSDFENVVSKNLLFSTKNLNNNCTSTFQQNQNKSTKSGLFINWIKMNFGLQHLAESLLNKTYSLEHHFVEHFISNVTTTAGSSTIRNLSKDVVNPEEPVDNSSVNSVLSDTYYDYWDENQSLNLSAANNFSAAAVNNLSAVATHLTRNSSSSLLHLSPKSIVNFHLNQTWMQSSSWNDFLIRNAAPLMIFAVFTLFIGFSLGKLYNAFKRRKVYSQYSLVYPEDGNTF